MDAKARIFIRTGQAERMTNESKYNLTDFESMPPRPSGNMNDGQKCQCWLPQINICFPFQALLLALLYSSLNFPSWTFVDRIQRIMDKSNLMSQTCFPVYVYHVFHNDQGGTSRKQGHSPSIVPLANIQSQAVSHVLDCIIYSTQSAQPLVQNNPP